MFSSLHKVKTLIIFSIVSILLIFLSCDIFDSRESEKLQIEGNILFCVQKAQEQGSSTAYQRIMISIFTEKTYPCTNYDIRTKVSKHGNKITIAFLYIVVPEICLTMLGPANTELFFNLADGEYSLNFFHNGITDKYELAVSDSTLIITEIESHFTEPSSNCSAFLQ